MFVVSVSLVSFYEVSGQREESSGVEILFEQKSKFSFSRLPGLPKGPLLTWNKENKKK